MVNVLITSASIIILLCITRVCLMGRISRRLQYFLWLAVAVRLLIPFQLFENVYSITAFIMPDEKHAVAEYQPPKETSNVPDGTDETVNASDAAGTQLIENIPADKTKGFDEKINLYGVLKCIWIVGTILAGLTVIVCNIIFFCRLRKNREEIGVNGKLRVYKSDIVSTPCLYGFIRPSIYLTDESMKSDERMRIILEHEMVHYRHMDHIWSIVRAICLIIYWFDPFVWLAAFVSASDAEMACDESVIKSIGSEKRIYYGQTILELASGSRGREIMFCSTGISGSRQELKNRIKLIAGRKKTKIVLCIFAAVCVGFLLISAFGRIKKDNRAVYKVYTMEQAANGEIEDTDLDADGIKEHIYVEIDATKPLYRETVYIIKVNDKEISYHRIRNGGMIPYICMFSLEDDRVYIGLIHREINQMYTDIYTFENNDLLDAGMLTFDLTETEFVREDGSVYLKYSQDFFGERDLKIPISWDNNSQQVIAADYWEVINPSFCIEITKDLTLRESDDEDAPVVTIKPQYAAINAVNKDGWLHLYGQDGTSGWLAISRGAKLADEGEGNIIAIYRIKLPDENSIPKELAEIKIPRFTVE